MHYILANPVYLDIWIPKRFRFENIMENGAFALLEQMFHFSKIF